MAKESCKDVKSSEPVSFEQALAQLEQCVQQLEEGRLGLSDSLACYERGIGLLKQCYQALEQVEHRIEQLASLQADGTAVTQPFYDRELSEETMSLEEKKRLRSRRRSQTAASPPRPADDQGDMDIAGGLF